MVTTTAPITMLGATTTTMAWVTVTGTTATVTMTIAPIRGMGMDTSTTITIRVSAARPEAAGTSQPSSPVRDLSGARNLEVRV